MRSTLVVCQTFRIYYLYTKIDFTKVYTKHNLSTYKPQNFWDPLIFGSIT